MTATATPPAPLDDVMLAMDVVDMLRHNERLVEKELNAGDREEDLIERLRQVYRSQGIEVPDAILQQGVKSLREERFVYKPPAEGLSTRLARAYVTRGRWGKWVIGATAAVGIGSGTLAYQGYQSGIELSQTIPASIERVAADIRRDTTVEAALARVTALVNDGRAAARDGRADQARAAVADLEKLRDDIRSEYEVRIVSRPGESTGVWRTPTNNPTAARSYYLIVEAIGRDGRPLSRSITAETDGRTTVVTKWGQRVPESLYRQVEADKRDDGIIQNPILGLKTRGQLEPRWREPLPGGAITRW